MKKVFAILMLLLMIVLNTTIALADGSADTYSVVPTEGVPAKGRVGSAEGEAVGLARLGGIVIETWRNSITEVSAGYVQCMCSTTTDWAADVIQNDFIVQRWNGSSWVTFSSADTSKSNVDRFENYISRTVSRGYYYRVKTNHIATLDQDSDQKVLYSSYIYVP